MPVPAWMAAQPAITTGLLCPAGCEVTVATAFATIVQVVALIPVILDAMIPFTATAVSVVTEMYAAWVAKGLEGRRCLDVPIHKRSVPLRCHKKSVANALTSALNTQRPADKSQSLLNKYPKKWLPMPQGVRLTFRRLPDSPNDIKMKGGHVTEENKT